MKIYQLHIYLDDELREKVRKAAFEADVSMAEIVRRALETYLRGDQELLETAIRIENWLHYELSMLRDDQIDEYNRDLNLFVAAIEKSGGVLER